GPRTGAGHHDLRSGPHLRRPLQSRRHHRLLGHQTPKHHRHAFLLGRTNWWRGRSRIPAESPSPNEVWRDVAGGTPDALRDFPRLSAMILEAVATFFMVLVIFATTRHSDLEDDHESPRSLAGFATGLVYFLGILIAGPFSGGALNPARA